MNMDTDISWWYFLNNHVEFMDYLAVCVTDASGAITSIELNTI